MRILIALMTLCGVTAAFALGEDTARTVESPPPREMTARRTARSVTFDNRNGTRTTRLYLTDIHWRDGDSFRAVDTVPQKGETKDVMPDVVDAGLYIHRYDSAEPSAPHRFECGGYAVTFTPAGDWAGRTVTRRHTGDGVKEEVTLSAAADPAVRWRVETDAGARFSAGELLFTAPDGTFLFRTPPPAAWDAAGRPAAVDAAFEGGELVYRLRYTADTAFPVTLDPSVSLAREDGSTGYLYNTGASYIATRNDSAAFGMSPVIVQAGQQHVTQYYTYRGVITVDTSPLPDVIEVTGATLEIVCSSVNAAVGFDVILAPGMFTGTFGTGWFNDFEGWRTSSSYSWTPVSDTRIDASSLAPGDTLRFDLNAHGLDTLIDPAGAARFMVLSDRDSSSTYQPGANYFSGYSSDISLTVTYRELVRPPANFTMTASGTGAIVCTWDDSSANEDRFLLMSLPDSTVIDTLAANASADTITGLSPNSFHRWTVAADSAGVRAFAPPDSAFTLLDPPAPGDIVIMPLAPDTLRVAAGPPPNAGMGDTALEVDSLSGTGATDSGWTGGAFRHDDGGLDTTGSYVYRLRYRNGDGIPTAWTEPLAFVMSGLDSLTVPLGGDAYDDYTDGGAGMRDSTVVRAGVSGTGEALDGYLTFMVPREIQRGGVESLTLTMRRTDEAAATAPSLTLGGIPDGDLAPVETLAPGSLGASGATVSWTVDSGTGERTSPNLRSLFREWQDRGVRYGFAHGFGLRLDGGAGLAGDRAVFLDTSNPAYAADTFLTVRYVPGAPDTLLAQPAGFDLTIVAPDSIRAGWDDTTVREYGFVLKNAADSTLVAGVDTLAADTEEVTVGGLTPNTVYGWFVEAFTLDDRRVSDAVAARTFARTPGATAVEVLSGGSLRFVLDPRDNPASTKFAVQDSVSGRYADVTARPDTLREGAPGEWAWGTWADWGAAHGDTLTALPPDSLHVIRAKARNGD